MRSARDSDLGPGLLIQLGGLVIPGAVVGVAAGPISASLPRSQFVLVAAGSFCVICWVLLAWLGLDRTDFLIASVFGPALAFLGVVGLQATLWALYYDRWGWWYGVFNYLTPDYGALLTYVAAFGVAGFAAVLLSRKLPVPGLGDAPAEEVG